MQNLHFFTGKGGVGKSTNASLFALKEIEKKKKLLISLDPAHNLKDIFKVKNLKDINKMVNDLNVLELSIDKMLKEYLSNTENSLKSSHTYLSSFNLLDNFSIIRHSPGIEEYGIFYGFEKTLKKYSNKKEILIFDMPPTGLSIRFFALPRLSLIWLNKLIELRYKIIEKKKMSAKVKRIKMPDDKVLANLLILKKNYGELENFMHSAIIHVVTNPEPLSINESIKLIKDLEELGYKNIEICLNKYKENLPSEIIPLKQKYNIVTIPDFENSPIGLLKLKKYSEVII